MEPFVDITLPMIKDKRRKSNLRGFFSRTASTDNSGASSTGAASDMPLQPGPSNSRMGQEEEALDSSDSEDGAPRVIHSAHSKSRRRSSLDPSLLKRKLSMRTHRRGSVNPPSDANASGSSTPADNACIPPPAKPASRFPIDATAPISEPDEEMPFQPASGSRRLTRAEAQYINTLLTEVSPKHLSPLERLRLSHSGLRRRSSPESGPASPDTASDAHPFQNGLYQALKQFTSVEVRPCLRSI